MKKIKVLIIDDSALIRRLFSDMLSSDPCIEVVGTANDPIEARSKIKQYQPDVATLDIEMPKMDGITFLGKLMRLHPMPVVMVSSHTQKGADCVMECLQIGAVDFMPKPSSVDNTTLSVYSINLISKIRAASQADVARHAQANVESRSTKGDATIHQPELLNCNTNVKMVAMGSSTGGTEALAKILKDVPVDYPPIMIAQHIPSKFSKAFADRLDRTCAVSVAEAQDGEELQAGHVYIAPGDSHLEVVKSQNTLMCKVYQGAKVNRHCPSVEVLFKSVATEVGNHSICLMLTGMGDDGSIAMRDVKEAGGVTIAQDEESSVVWGMPGVAVKLGCVDKVIALDDIAAELVKIAGDDASVITAKHSAASS